MTPARSRASKSRWRTRSITCPDSGVGSAERSATTIPNSDFEFEDQHGGDGIDGVSIDQETGESLRPLIGIIPPANLFGLSKHVSSTQLYWGSDTSGTSRRSTTRGPATFSSSRETSLVGFATPRFNERLDLRVRYRLNEHVQVKPGGKEHYWMNHVSTTVPLRAIRTRRSRMGRDFSSV